VAPAPASLDYSNRTVVNFQRVAVEINTGTRAAVYHISDTPTRDLGSGHTASVIDLYLHRVAEKTGPFVISSYLCFDSYEFHENFQKYTQEVLLVVNME